MIQKKNGRQAVSILFFILFVATPLVSALLFCMKDGKAISDIYIPLGGWSDEITYYKQIEGILSHGMPRGYFGYNQSSALYGTLGVWGVVPLIPYVIWGCFFGWNYGSPIYANIFFCTLALFFIYILLRPKKISMGILSLFWIANPFLNRYVLSGVVEASVLSQLMIVTACGIYLLPDKCKRAEPAILPDSAPNIIRRLSAHRDTFLLLLCTALICLLTLARPYFAVLFLIPLWKALRDRRRSWITALPVLAAVVMILFFVNNHFFCSTYFKNILSFENIMEGGVSGFFVKLFHSILEIAKLIWYALRYPGSGVGWYYLLLGIELLGMTGVCVYRKCRHQNMPPMFLITLIGNPLILLSIIEMYDLGVGARHILSLIVANAVVLILESHVSWGILLTAVCLFSLLRIKGADALPYRNADYSAYMESLQQEFSRVVTVTEDISYHNVVAMPTLDTDARNPEQKVSTYYGLLFAMPSGVGISLDYEEFYEDPSNLQAGYILVHPDGTIRSTLEDMGMHCVFENQELALYAK